MKAKKIRIEVLLEDIWNGLYAEPRKCPIALATKRAMPKIKVCVKGGYLDLHGHISYPAEVSKFINDFDAGKKVHPFSFIAIV